MNIEAPSLVDWIAAITLVVAVVALVVSLYTLKAARDAVVPLRDSVVELKRAAELQTKALGAMTSLVQAMVSLRSIEQLSREANALNIVVTSLASIARIPQRLNIHPKTADEYDQALNAAYSEERMHLAIALATIPHLDLPLTRKMSKLQEFADASAKVTPAQTEASTKLGELVTRIAAESLHDPGTVQDIVSSQDGT